MTDNMDFASLSPMGGEIVGTCEDFCPEAERIRRVQENDIHKLEILPGCSDKNYYRSTMVKKFQKSSADHNIQIAEYLRTPETLLRTITYIEDVIMNKADDSQFSHGDASSKLVVYLFIWDRYRMIAKDYTLQSSALPVTDLWLECHERMTRWMIYADQFMRTEETYLLHAQQNGEQMNNLLKTLHGYYFKDPSTNCNITLQKMNQCEFIGYFVIFQIGNGGEVTKYLQRLPTEILKSKELTFAIAVWTAIRTDNYAKFFKLMKQGNLLQKCVMFRYLGEVRLKALRKLLRAFYVQAKTAVKIIIPIQYFQELLLFDEIQETIDFFNHCGINLKMESQDQQLYVSIEGQNIDQLLPRDANGFPVNPKVPMVNTLVMQGLQQKSEGDEFTIQDICRGLASVCEGPIFTTSRPISTSVIPSTTSTKKPSIRIKPAGTKPTPGTRPVLTLPSTKAATASQPIKAPTVASQDHTSTQNPSKTVPVPRSKAAASASLNVNAKPFVPGNFSFPPPPAAAVVPPSQEMPFTSFPAGANPFSTPIQQQPASLAPKETFEFGMKLRQPSKDNPTTTFAAPLQPPAFTMGKFESPAFPLTAATVTKTKSKEFPPTFGEMPPPPSRTTSASLPPSSHQTSPSLPSGKAALPLLSAKSIDEFIQRSSSVDVANNPSLLPPSIGFPADMPNLSRASSLRSDAMSMSPAMAPPSNALLANRSLSTTREPIKRQPSVADSPRLLHLEKQFLIRRKRLRLMYSFRQWKLSLVQRQRQIHRFLLKRSFIYWSKIYRKTTFARKEFFSSIQSIDMRGSGSTTTSSTALTTTKPTSISVYQPPHRRSLGVSNQFLSTGASNIKRKPLRDYTILSAESIVQDMQTMALEDSHQPQSHSSPSDLVEENRLKEGASIVSSSSLSSRFIFRVAFTDLCGLAFFLQQTKAYLYHLRLTSPTLVEGERMTVIEEKNGVEENVLRLETYLANGGEENDRESAVRFSETYPVVSRPEIRNTASSLRDGLLYVRNQYFTEEEKIKKRLFWPSDLYTNITVITPAQRKGVYVNSDCPFISTYRAYLTNSKGFFTNFQKKNELSGNAATKNDNSEEEEEEDDVEEKRLVKERIELLRCYQQSPDRISEMTDYLDLSQEKLGFQLSVEPQDCYFQIQNCQESKQYQVLHRRIHMNIQEITFNDLASQLPVYYQIEQQSTSHLQLLFFSNYYSAIEQLHVWEDCYDYYQQTSVPDPQIPRFATIILYLPSRDSTEAKEETLLEFTCFPSLDDLIAAGKMYQILFTDEEQQILSTFFHPKGLPTIAINKLKAMIGHSLVVLKFSNHYYQKLVDRKGMTAPNSDRSLSKESDHNTVSIPIIQYQSTATEDKRLLQRSLRNFLSNAFERLVFPPEKKSNQKVEQRVTFPLSNPIIERIQVQDFLRYALCSFFSPQQYEKSQQNRLPHRHTTSSQALVSMGNPTKPSSIIVYSRIIECFFQQLFRFQEYYYHFIAGFQMTMTKQVTETFALPHYPLSTGYYQSSFGLMKLFASDRNISNSSNSSHQYIAVDIPCHWNDQSYNEKIELLLSNIIFPIEDFLNHYQLSYRQYYEKLITSSSSSHSSMIEDPRNPILRSLLDEIHTMEDVLVFGEQIDNYSRQSSSSDGKNRFLVSWKRLLRGLVERYNNSEGFRYLMSEETSKTLEKEFRGMLLELVMQRLETVCAVMRDYYQNRFGSSREKIGLGCDFDYLYYQHRSRHYEPGFNLMNPFIEFCRIVTSPSQLIKSWEQDILSTVENEIKKEKKAQKRKLQESKAEPLNRTNDDRSHIAATIAPMSLQRKQSQRSAQSVDWTRLLLGEDSAPATYSPHDEDNLRLKKRAKIVLSPTSPHSAGFSPRRRSPFSPHSALSRNNDEEKVNIDKFRKELDHQRLSSKLMLQKLQDKLVSWD